ncbi:hypothetical protein TRVA0_027S01354 [Trichomonascus vanleenenianus]|uniref:Zn(II)2Cys6 transcription factor domain-containing protein n=1 Tax=Trichomonascus vanleenenianus TaxID=2268995 RepID=UPI003ECAAD7F
MKAPRYAKSRQKSCQQCSLAKAKCDRRPDRCTRCAQRGLACAYPQIPKPIVVNEEGPSFAAETLLPSLTSELSMECNSQDGTTDIRLAKRCPESPKRSSEEAPDFSNLDLICPINADDIRTRWLNSYVTGLEQKVKEYPASVIGFTRRILNSYAAIASRGRGTLPFVHPTQLRSSSPLSTCLSIVRICEEPLPGSEHTAAAILQREMEKLVELCQEYDHMFLLATFQAYLIYTMVLFFRLSQGPHPFFRRAMMNLQELACSTSRQGLVCAAEQYHARPRWEEWIVCEAKRRTLFVMYLFDSVLSAQENLPTYLGIELHGLAAPAQKSLWEAKARCDWGTEYNVHLAEWAEFLTIDELWPIPEGMDDTGIAQRRRRVDQWLENVDEFGTMLFAVTSCTHGG